MTKRSTYERFAARYFGGLFDYARYVRDTVSGG